MSYNNPLHSASQDDALIVGNQTIRGQLPDGSDGNLEVTGRVISDRLESYTQGSAITVMDPVRFPTLATDPTVSQSATLLWSSASKSGRLVTLGPDGNVIDIAPARNRGDLTVFNGPPVGQLRKPVGLPRSRLEVDKGAVGSISWRGFTSRDRMITTPTDAYIRIAHFVLNNDFNLTNSYSTVPLGASECISRVDVDAFELSGDGSVTVADEGTYAVTYRATFMVEADVEENWPAGQLAHVEMGLQTWVGVSSPQDIVGTLSTLTFPRGVRRTVESTVILQLGANSKLRVVAKENKRSTQKVAILGDLTSLLIEKVTLGPDVDQSEYIFVRGTTSQRPALNNSSWATVPFQSGSPQFASNNNDVVTVDGGGAGIVVEHTGRRIAHVKVALTTVGATLLTDQVAVESEIFVNNVSLGTSRATCTLTLGSSLVEQVNNQVNFAQVLDLVAGDRISLRAKIDGDPLTTGNVVILAESTSIAFTMYSRTDQPWRFFTATEDGYQTIDVNDFAPLALVGSSIEGPADDFKTFSGTAYNSLIISKEAGTYSWDYTVKLTVPIASVETQQVIVGLEVDTGDGLKILGDSLSCNFVHGSPDVVREVTCSASGIVNLDAGSVVRIVAWSSAISGEDVDITLDTDGLSFNLHKIEVTRAFLTENNEFGTFFKSVGDSNSIYTTSNTFVDRLAVATINLPAGEYRVACIGEWTMTEPAYSMEARIILDDADVLWSTGSTPSTITEWRTLSYFTQVTLLSAHHKIALQVRAPDGEAVVTQNVGIELWRI